MCWSPLPPAATSVTFATLCYWWRWNANEVPVAVALLLPQARLRMRVVSAVHLFFPQVVQSLANEPASFILQQRFASLSKHRVMTRVADAAKQHVDANVHLVHNVAR